MSTPQPVTTGVDTEAPLNNFSECHAGIRHQLQAMGALPGLADAARRAREVAERSLHVFRHAVLVHHAEEEEELFPTVLRSAAEGVEREQVQGLVDRLIAEHRSLEALWRRIEPGVQATAKGRDGHVDEAVLEELVRAYGAHARFEEEHFLPLAQQVLARDGNHMAALGLALHMRHVPAAAGYI